MLNELLKNLNEYIISLSNPVSFWEYFATVICPIISTIALVVCGGFALYKYRASKNYDINLKILTEVYLPLYTYLVKQEIFRFIACPEISWEEVPILEIKSTKTKQTWNEQGVKVEKTTAAVCGCTRDTLLELCDSANLGLASPELVTLLNSYKVLIHITSGSINSKEKAKAAIMQEKLEIALRKEILKGYNYYHKKLKLQSSNSDIYTVSKNQINYLPEISEAEISATIDELNSMEQD